MKKIVNNLILLVSVMFFSCTSEPSAQVAENRILIYATNDMHGNIDPYAKVVPYMKEVRAHNKNVLLLSAGDMFTGNPYVDYFSTPGLPIIEMMNEAGYDVATIGNHEFDYGQQALEKCMDKAMFSFVCANVKAEPEADIKKVIEPYMIVDTGGTRVCVLGLLETDNRHDGYPIPTCHPDHLKGLKFTDPIETAKKYKYLRKHCDLFIALTHLGVKGDSVLAVNMPELDVIVGGHTHTQLDGGKYINGVLVTQAGSRMDYLGMTTVNMKNGQVVDKSNELIEIKPMNEDKNVKARIEEYYNDPSFAEKIGVSADEFPTRRQVAFMMADVMKEHFKVDFTFQNIGGVRCETFPKGDVVMADLYKITPFNNDVMMVRMNAADIRSFLFSSSKHLKDEVDLVPSGLLYTLTKKGEEITEVKLTDYEGKPLDESKVYSVAMNSYLAGRKYTCRETAVNLHSSEIDMLVNYLKESPVKRSPVEKRWTIVR